MAEGGLRGGEPSSRLMSPKAVLSVLNSVVGAVLGTAALIFIAKNMGPNVMGTLGFSMAAIGVLSFFSDFGASSVHRMQVKSGADLGKCVGAYAAIKLVLLGIFAGLTILLVEFGEGGVMAGNPVVKDTLEVFLVYYLLLGVSQIATHTFEAMDSVAKVYAPSLLELVVRVSFIIFVATSYLGKEYEAPALLASSYALGIIAATILAAILLVRVPIKKPDRVILMKYMRSLAPVFFISMIIILDLYLDKAVVGYFWGSTEVGLYFGVQKMAIFVSVFSLAVASLILPSVTTYFNRNDVAASWDLVNQAERYVSLIAIPTAAFYLTWGSQMLTVFLTKEFASAVSTMDVLVITGTLVALVLPLRSAIAGVGSPRTLFWVGAGAIAIQVGLMAVLVPKELFDIPMFGLKGFGAALSLLVASIYSFFLLRYMAWKTAKIVPNSRSFLHLVSAAIMIGVMYVVNYLFIPTIDGVALIVLAAVGVASYVASAYVLGELETSDYLYFRALLNPQDAIQYAVHELLGKKAQ